MFDPAAIRFAKLVSEIPQLSRKEEYELVVRWKKTGDKSAADRVLRANLRYVVQVAFRYKFSDILMSDLLSEGCVGLTYALRKFEPDRNLRFVTYAVNWIRAKVLGHIANNTRQVRVSTNGPDRRMFFGLRKEYAKALAQLGDENAALLIAADVARVSPERAKEELSRLPDVALDREVADGDFSPLSRLASSAPSPEDLAIENEERHHTASLAMSVLDALDPRERKIILERHCRDHEDALTLDALGKHFGLSRERVRQLEVRAFKKLRSRVGLGEKA